MSVSNALPNHAGVVPHYGGFRLLNEAELTQAVGGFVVLSRAPATPPKPAAASGVTIGHVGGGDVKVDILGSIFKPIGVVFRWVTSS